MSKKIDIEKDKGPSNYHTWCFVIENLLIYNGYEKCIIEDATEREKDTGKME